MWHTLPLTLNKSKEKLWLWVDMPSTIELSSLRTCNPGCSHPDFVGNTTKSNALEFVWIPSNRESGGWGHVTYALLSLGENKKTWRTFILFFMGNLNGFLINFEAENVIFIFIIFFQIACMIFCLLVFFYRISFAVVIVLWTLPSLPP